MSGAGGHARWLERGFTLVELALTVALIGVLSTIAISGYANYQERARTTQVIVDIKNMSTELDRYEIATGRLPSTLAQAGVGECSTSGETLTSTCAWIPRTRVTAQGQIHRAHQLRLRSLQPRSGREVDGAPHREVESR